MLNPGAAHFSHDEPQQEQHEEHPDNTDVRASLKNTRNGIAAGESSGQYAQEEKQGIAREIHGKEQEGVKEARGLFGPREYLLILRLPRKG